MTDIATWYGDNQLRLQPHAGSGHWNDPDMVNNNNKRYIKMGSLIIFF